MSTLNREAVALNLQIHIREVARLESEPNSDQKELEIEREAVQRYQQLRALFPQEG
jgi:hypothetical protein